MKEMFTLIDAHSQWDEQATTKTAGLREKP